MTKKIVIGIIVAIVILGLIGAASPKKETTSTKETTVSQKQEAPLSQRVQEAYLKQVGYATIADLNLNKDNIVSAQEASIIKFEDQGKGNVNVTAQANLDRDQLRMVGNSVLSAITPLDGLTSITVWGSNGIHRIVYVADIK